MQAAVEAARGTQTPAANVTQEAPDKTSSDRANSDRANSDSASTDRSRADTAGTEKSSAGKSRAGRAGTGMSRAGRADRGRADTGRADTGTGRQNRDAGNGRDERPDPITEPLPRLQAAVTAQEQTATGAEEGPPQAANSATVTPARPGPPWPAQDRPGADRPAQGRPAQDRPAQDRPAQDGSAGDRPAGQDRPAALDRATSPRRLGRPDRGALPRRDPDLDRLEPPSRSVPRRPAEPDQPAAARPSRPRAALPAPTAPAGQPARDKLSDRKKRPAQKKRSAQKRQSAQDTNQVQTGWPAQGGWPAETGPAGTRPASARPASIVPGSTETGRGPAGRKARPSRPRVVGVAAVAVVLVAAGTVAAVLTSRAQAPKPAANRTAGPRTAASRAADWVASQVSRSAVVACDHIMCSALASAGFPKDNLQSIEPSSPYPVHADVVVVTPVVQRQFGNSLATQVAPSILVQFGKGAATISIRVVAKQGAAAYVSALAADLKLRRVGSATLLASRQVTASALARKDLIGGRVDARLIVVLTALASVQPIDIVSFGTVRGASADVPLRMVDIAPDDAAAKLRATAYQQSLDAVLHAEQAPYAPLSAGPVGSGKQSVFQIQFSAPSPLGLLGPQGP
jgi:hypothetical protein